MFTKQHYELLADWLHAQKAKVDQAVWEDMLHTLSERLKEDSSKFKYMKFAERARCGRPS